jgi:hypothetical protein
MAGVAAPSFVSISSLTVSDEFQMRLKLDRSIVSEYAEMVKESDGSWPFADPCSVYRVKDELILVDGFHRVAAIKQAGEDQVSVAITDGSRLDAKKAAFSANQSHGLRLTNADKRHKVTIALKDSVLQKWSDRKLAELCGVSNRFVTDMRGELCTVHSSPAKNEPSVKVGADGKSRPASKPDADMQRKKIVAAVVANEEASDRKIAEMVGCDHKTVGKVRREVESESVITHPAAAVVADDIEDDVEVDDSEAPRDLIDMFVDIKTEIRLLLHEVPAAQRENMWREIVKQLGSEDILSW